jgi:hypothetical protein
MNRTASGTFTFAGSLAEAEKALVGAGFAYYPLGEHTGFDEFRSPGTFITGSNSGHFNVLQTSGSPKTGVPQTTGDMHFGEHNPFGGIIPALAHCIGDGACKN